MPLPANGPTEADIMSSNPPEISGRCEDRTGRYRADWTRAPSVSMAVVEAVAAAEDVDPLELEPLNDTIDPDALDTLFSSATNQNGVAIEEVSLTFGGRDVTVRDTGELVVRPPGPSAGA